MLNDSQLEMEMKNINIEKTIFPWIVHTKMFMGMTNHYREVFEIFKIVKIYCSSLNPVVSARYERV